jgi:homoserine dehydrogenase
MELKLAFVGFGNVAQEFARLLDSRKDRLAAQNGMSWRTTGIATGKHGCILSSSGIDLKDVLQRLESRERLVGLPDTSETSDALSLIEHCKADIVFETTPLSPMDGEPAATYIRKALERGIHVVTANKGPIACAYRELKTLAEHHQVKFRFEGTVMDGAPVFNLKEYCLPAAQVTSFAGLLNSTTNVILTGLEAGHSFAESLAEAQRLGIAEANADYDIDGWDAAVKAVALANVLMNADIHPKDVLPTGIRDISVHDLHQAREAGKAIRLLARAESSMQGVKIVVAPETVPSDSLFGNLQGTSNALVIHTDLMGELVIVENHPGITQTAYALLSDLIRISEETKF